MAFQLLTIIAVALSSVSFAAPVAPNEHSTNLVNRSQIIPIPYNAHNETDFAHKFVAKRDWFSDALSGINRTSVKTIEAAFNKKMVSKIKVGGFDVSHAILAGDTDALREHGYIVDAVNSGGLTGDRDPAGPWNYPDSMYGVDLDAQRVRMFGTKVPRFMRDAINDKVFNFKMGPDDDFHLYGSENPSALNKLPYAIRERAWRFGNAWHYSDKYQDHKDVLGTLEITKGLRSIRKHYPGRKESGRGVTREQAIAEAWTAVGGKKQFEDPHRYSIYSGAFKKAAERIVEPHGHHKREDTPSYFRKAMGVSAETDIHADGKDVVKTTDGKKQLEHYWGPHDRDDRKDLVAGGIGAGPNSETIDSPVTTEGKLPEGKFLEGEGPTFDPEGPAAGDPPPPYNGPSEADPPPYSKVDPNPANRYAGESLSKATQRLMGRLNKGSNLVKSLEGAEKAEDAAEAGTKIGAKIAPELEEAEQISTKAINGVAKTAQAFQRAGLAVTRGAMAGAQAGEVAAEVGITGAEAGIEGMQAASIGMEVAQGVAAGVEGAVVGATAAAEVGITAGLIGAVGGVMSGLLATGPVGLCLDATLLMMTMMIMPMIDAITEIERNVPEAFSFQDKWLDVDGDGILEHVDQYSQWASRYNHAFTVKDDKDGPISLIATLMSRHPEAASIRYEDETYGTIKAFWDGDRKVPTIQEDPTAMGALNNILMNPHTGTLRKIYQTWHFFDNKNIAGNHNFFIGAVIKAEWAPGVESEVDVYFKFDGRNNGRLVITGDIDRDGEREIYVMVDQKDRGPGEYVELIKDGDIKCATNEPWKYYCEKQFEGRHKVYGSHPRDDGEFKELWAMDWVLNRLAQQAQGGGWKDQWTSYTYVT